jgi:hypothetical protein
MGWIHGASLAFFSLLCESHISARSTYRQQWRCDAMRTIEAQTELDVQEVPRVDSSVVPIEQVELLTREVERAWRLATEEVEREREAQRRAAERARFNLD